MMPAPSQVLSHYGMQLFRRPLTADELKSAVEPERASWRKSQKDFYAGLRYGLASCCRRRTSCSARRWRCRPPTRSYTLDPYSRATRLSYLMWNTTPGRRTAGSGRDRRTEHRRRAGQAGRPPDGLAAAGSRHARLLQRHAGAGHLRHRVQGLASSIPKWSSAIAASAKEETLRTTIGLTLHDNGDMRDLMTTRKTYINRAWRPIYQLAFPFKGDWVRV